MSNRLPLLVLTCTSEVTIQPACREYPVRPTLTYFLQGGSALQAAPLQETELEADSKGIKRKLDLSLE